MDGAPPTGTAVVAGWYLYVIECEDGSLYTGITTDVARRFAQHVAGKGARYTRSHRPVRLLGSVDCGTRSEALKAELAVKRLPARSKRAYCAGLTPPVSVSIEV